MNKYNNEKTFSEMQSYNITTIIYHLKITAYRLMFNIKRAIVFYIAFYNDYARYLKYSLFVKHKQSHEHAMARILLLMHALEKGLSMQTKKTGYGIIKAETLLKEIKKFLDLNPVNELVETAIGVLIKYANDPQSGSNSDFKNKLNQAISVYKINRKKIKGGFKFISKDTLDFDGDFESLYRIAASRSSIREYSKEEITETEIILAAKYAQTAPSVCNRQTSRIHVFSREKMTDILNNQLGDQGWADSANKLFVIASDLRYFTNVYERNQVFIDGGMFAMQFVMGLHIQKIATCFKMYIRTPKIDNDFYKITGIAKSEVPIVLIMAGKFKDIKVKVPYSFRYPTEKILYFHNCTTNTS